MASKDDIALLLPNAASSAAAQSLNEVEVMAAAGNLLERAESRSVNLQRYQPAAQLLRNAAPEYASLVTSEPTDLHDIQQLLDPGELLLEYYEADESLSSIDSDEYQDIGAELYDLLLKPVVGEMTAATGITIVPHGVLHYMPFAALYSGEEYLVDQKPTRVLPSASVLQFLGKRHQDDASLLVLGNPDRNSRSMDLPGAEREAVAIVKQNRDRVARSGVSLTASPTTVLLLRGQTTETAIKQTAAKFQYIHFASHGVFDDQSPFNS